MIMKKITTLAISSVLTIREYVEDALRGFERDPASSEYQKGYEACLIEINKLVNKGLLR